MPTERHYDPTNDLLFKFVFGNEKRKHITLQFINDVMGLEDDMAFVDLHFKNSELPPEKEKDKLGRLDVFVVTNDGKKVDIEMQAVPHASMPKRTLFYWAHSYLQLAGLKSGEEYGLLRPAININVMRNVCLPHNMNKAHSVYKILETDTQHCLTDDLEIHFLEIPKYRYKSVKDLSPLECWFAYFANKLSDNEKEELIVIKPAVGDAIEASKKYIMNDEDYWSYLAREAAILDYNTDRKAALTEGREEGHKAGLEEGHATGVIEGERNADRRTALRLLKKQYPIDEVLEIVDLSRSELQKLAKEIE